MDFRANSGAQRGRSKIMQIKSEQLQKENNEMEQRIVALRQMMQREREERERLGGSRWKSSKISQEKQQVVPKSEIKPNRIKNQPKFKILSDKPLETYSKKSVDVSSVVDNATLCGQCERVKAKVECIECGEIYCPPCYKQFHAKGAMRKHGWQPIEQERPRSSNTRTSCASSSSRQRTPACKSDKFSSEQADSVDISVERDEAEVKSGGRLLEGSYDEQESAASFQEALREWRNQPSNPPGQKNGLWVNPVGDPKSDSKSCDTEDNIGIQASTEVLQDITLNFSSSLSYADRLMLKKHRKNPESTTSYNRPRNKESTRSRAVSKTPNLKSGSGSPRILNGLLISGKQDGKKQTDSPSKQKSLGSNENTYPSVLQIQLLPSDEDESKYGSSDLDSSSPIVNYTVDESPSARTDRRTLSQMGRLAIVELSFSDPENDVNKSKDGNCSSGLTNHSPISFKRASSGLKSPPNDSINIGNAHIPHPPNAPSNTYVARQKILMEKKKKCNNGQVPSGANPKKTPPKRTERKWQPSSKYVGLNSFFMAGVEKDSIDSVVANNENPSLRVADGNNYPTVSVALADSWKQESSLSQVEESGVNKGIITSPKKHSKVRNKAGKVNNNNKKIIDHKREQNHISSTEKINVHRSQDVPNPKIITGNTALTTPNTDTPRVSMTDFDFLSALPPASKGDDLLKLHRASTVTLFALSPQPPDVWNDDSEIEIPSAVHTTPEREQVDAPPTDESTKKQSLLSESDRKEIDNDDTLALEALSKEIKENNNKSGNKLHSRGVDYHWEDDSLSIEDNDDGSGLTSSADGEESDDPDSKDFIHQSVR